jgi:putative transposase
MVSWMITHRETDTLANRFSDDTCKKQHIHSEQLTTHADWGSSMKSKTVTFPLADWSSF